MPVLIGLQALKSIKQRFKAANDGLLKMYVRVDGSYDSASELPFFIQRPLICYYSQMPKPTMKNFMRSEETPDYYIEKPIPFKELVSFLRLLNIL